MNAVRLLCGFMVVQVALSAGDWRLSEKTEVSKRELEQIESTPVGLLGHWINRSDYYDTNWYAKIPVQMVENMITAGRFPEKDFGSGQSRSLLRSSLRDSFSEYVIENNPFVQRMQVLFDDIVDGKLFRFFMNGLREEKDQISSPFDDVRLPLSDSGVKSGFNEGIRPFRTDPYGFVNYTLAYGGEEMFTVQSRVYYRDFHVPVAEAVIQVPIDSTGWKVGLGYRFAESIESRYNDEFERQRYNGLFIGVQGPLMSGTIHAEFETSADRTMFIIVYGIGF